MGWLDGEFSLLCCEGCGKPMADRTMGGIHTGCETNPDPGNRRTAPAFRRREVVPFDPAWADARPLCHVCRKPIPKDDALLVPTGASVEDDEEVVGVLIHRSGCEGGASA